MVAWIGIAFLVGWVGGYCFGWLSGTKDTERRWSDSVGRYEDAKKRL